MDELPQAPERFLRRQRQKRHLACVWAQLAGLAPGMNLYRAPMCGRNFEYLGEDPILAGTLVARLIEGTGSYIDPVGLKAYAALFATTDGERRLKRPDVWRPFARQRALAKIQKRVTPHLLRHTAATQLLFNGCPVGHIKEILGHERLETTCRYCLGLDHRAAKAAHAKYLNYNFNL